MTMALREIRIYPDPALRNKTSRVERIDSSLDRYWKYGLCIPVVVPCVVEEDNLLLENAIFGRLANRKSKTLIRHILRVFDSKRRKIAVFFMARGLQKL